MPTATSAPPAWKGRFCLISSRSALRLSVMTDEKLRGGVQRGECPSFMTDQSPNHSLRSLQSATRMTSPRFFRPPKQTRSRETLDRILDSAEHVLAEKSFGEATLAEIMERAGVTV